MVRRAKYTLATDYSMLTLVWAEIHGHGIILRMNNVIWLFACLSKSQLGRLIRSVTTAKEVGWKKMLLGL
jgi:hypothetical protein